MVVAPPIRKPLRGCIDSSLAPSSYRQYHSVYYSYHIYERIEILTAVQTNRFELEDSACVSFLAATPEYSI